LAVALCHAQTVRSLSVIPGATGYARGRHK
jgi:hypothetical protein